MVAYGRLIPRWMLDLPRYGNLNLHGSLLPKYRGAAPIQWAVANGETVTGVTTMRLDEGMDTGDMLLRREVAHRPGTTRRRIFSPAGRAGRAADGGDAGGPGGRHASRRRSRTTASRRMRADADAGGWPHRSGAHGAVIYDRWRGFQPWPGAWTTVRGKKLTLHRLRRGYPRNGGEPGIFHVEGDRLFFTAGDGGGLEVTGGADRRQTPHAGSRSAARAWRGRWRPPGLLMAASRVHAARMAAFRVLLAMERSSNTHCDELLRAPAMESLSQADRNLTTALVMGVLRWQLALDAMLAGYLKKKFAWMTQSPSRCGWAHGSFWEWTAFRRMPRFRKAWS